MIKLHRDTMSEKSDPNEFKMVVFNNGNPEDLFLLVCYFNLILQASVAFQMYSKVQYLYTLVRGEALLQFYTLYTDVESTTQLKVEANILGLGLLFSCIFLSKQKRAMRHGMRNPLGLKVRLYIDCLIDLNKYLALFPGVKLTKKLV